MNPIQSLLAFLLFVLSGCAGGGETAQNRTEESKLKPLVTLTEQMLSSDERVPGNVRAILSATIQAKISGRVAKLLVGEGQEVKEGDLLLELDAHEVQARVEQADAVWKQAEADLKRFKQLLPSGAVTRQAYDASEARAKVAEAGVSEAKAMAAYASIRAPFDGIVAKKFLDQGDQAEPGRPLLQVERIDAYRFEADVPESSAATLSIGQSLTVSLAGVDERFTGKLIEMSPITDPNSRTRHIKIELPTLPILRSGQFGYVNLPGHAAAQVTIPVASKVQRGQVEGVFVVESGRAVLRLIRTGKVRDGEIQVLSGLSAGDIVVLDPSGVREGDLIEEKR